MEFIEHGFNGKYLCILIKCIIGWLLLLLYNRSLGDFGYQIGEWEMKTFSMSDYSDGNENKITETMGALKNVITKSVKSSLSMA
jgi:hypothetical protein